MDNSTDYPNWLKAFPPEPAPDAHGPRRIPKRKNKLGKKRTNNRKVGRLAGITKIPLDVFYEVVSYLHPSDLLRISRISKHFRTMLMTKNAVSFWRAARKNIGLPSPPPDLNDAQYVALIFENVCSACGAAVGLRKILSLKVQLCKKCRWHNIKDADKLFSQLDMSFKDFDWSLVLPAEDHLVQDRMDNPPHMAPHPPNPGETVYGPQIKVMINQLLTLQGEAREAYVEQQRRTVQDTLNFIGRHNDWEKMCQTEYALEEVRRTRIVCERLEALGYDRRDMQWGDNTNWGKLFTKGGKINEKYWREASLPSLRLEMATWEKLRILDEFFMNILNGMP